jgi:N-acetylmuramoyl-L-alanine amidase
MPAIIGESSYLTHPAVEENLKLSNKQKLEAEAYFLGILEYFHRGIPRLQRLSPVESTLSTVPAIVFQTEDSGGLGIDPDAIHMSLNRREVAPIFDRASGKITYRLGWDAPNGPYEMSLTVRNLMGNSSHEAKYDFTIDFPPHTAVFEPYPPAAPVGGGIVRMQCRLLDRRGMPVSDGTSVEVAEGGGASPLEVVVRGGKIEYPIVARPGSENLQTELTCRGERFTFDIQRASAEEPRVRGMFIKNALNDGPVTNASIVRGGSVIQSGSTAGLYLVPAEVDSGGIRIEAPGFQPVTVGGPQDTVSISPWFDGTLFGKRFLLDPQGGRAAGAGRLGLSAAHVNLLVARYLSAYLQTAGALVRLTRHSEEIRTPQDIVAMANRFHADRYIEIRRDNSPPGDGRAVRTYHFPGSRLGPDFAGSINESLSGILSLPPTVPEELVTYPLQQTACPAIVIEAPSIGDIDEELLLGEAWYQRLQAYGVFLGILRHFEMSQSCSLLVTVTSEDDASNWLAVVDGTWKLLTNPNGQAMFHALAAGVHSIEIQRGPLILSRQIELTAGFQNEIHFHPESE